MQDRKLLTRLDKDYERPNFVDLFKSLSAHHTTVKKGSFMVCEGEPIDKIICIKSGYVKLFRVSKEGQTTISYVYGANYLLGLRALTSEDNLASHTAEAISDTEILILSPEDILKCNF